LLALFSALRFDNRAMPFASRHAASTLTQVLRVDPQFVSLGARGVGHHGSLLMKVAKECGLAVPPHIVARADEMIE
jgi:hypothetical protein